ncbi:MAG: threonine/serine exporter family protein [Lachnospiraceae bacterium]|nr:threonine/serine exporter family protein [Lachnospiraceae bacterium]
MIENSGQLLSAILDVGEIMLVSGAEVNRVENTIQHMAAAYGYSKVDVFTITSSIVVTVREPGGNIETQTRRIRGYDTDMRRVERCNSLSRAVCREVLPLAGLLQEIEDIRQEKRYPGWLVFLIYGTNSAVFSAFFGGSIQDMAAAFLGGLVLRLTLLAGNRLKVQNIILTILCSAAAALSAVCMVRIGLGESADQIIIGNIMLLIPGLALTTSLRDMISGDLISGLLGLCEAVIRAVAIAFGVALVLWQTGGGF